jgi:hypothetical protein
LLEFANAERIAVFAGAEVLFPHSAGTRNFVVTPK